MRIAKKSDFVVLCLIIAAAAAIILLRGASDQGKLFVEIYEGNTLIERRALDAAADGVIELEHAAVEIDDGSVFFRHSDCPDKVCMHSGKIEKNGQMLACVPNGIVVQIVGLEPSERLSANITGYFDTVSKLVTAGLDEDEFRAVYSEFSRQLDIFHDMYSIYESGVHGANIYDINDAADGEELEVSRDLAEMLEYSRVVYDFTGGKVNIYLGDLVELWKNALETGVPPQINELRDAAMSANPDMIQGDGTKIKRSGSGKIDVGALAKGYALDKIAAELEKSLDGGSALIAMGGNICAVGKAENWKVGIKHPRGDGVLGTFLLPYGSAVATSGDYERFFEYEGMRYHHIIDPGTMMPAVNIVTERDIKALANSNAIKILSSSQGNKDDKIVASVTVIANSGALADALTTALFIMPVEEGLKLASDKGAEVLYVLSDLEIFASAGFPEITPTE